MMTFNKKMQMANETKVETYSLLGANIAGIGFKLTVCPAMNSQFFSLVKQLMSCILSDYCM